MIVTSVFFAVTKSQRLFFVMLIVLMLIPLLWIIRFAPESPMYLLSKNNYEELHWALVRVSQFNGCYDKVKIQKIVAKLK